MRIIAVDPGYDRAGIAVLESHNGKETVLFSTCIETKKTDTLSERIFTLGEAFEKLIGTYTPTVLGIETLFFNKNQKTGIGVAGARGALIFLAQKYGCTVMEFGPQEIKVAVTGYGKSDKTAVIDMVKRLVQNAPQKALDDEYDAIAVGITTLAHCR